MVFFNGSSEFFKYLGLLEHGTTLNLGMNKKGTYMLFNKDECIGELYKHLAKIVINKDVDNYLIKQDSPPTVLIDGKSPYWYLALTKEVIY